MKPAEREAAREWRDTVMRRSDGLSIVSGEPAAQAHHVLSQQVLRRRARELALDASELLWDPRNGIALTEAEHRRHHSRHTPIARHFLPVLVWDFAANYELTYRLERDYPLQEAA